MTLRGRRMDTFCEIWCLLASGSFQKSNIGWPQKPLTEKVLNLNMIFRHATKITFFQNIEIKLNSSLQ